MSLFPTQYPRIYNQFRLATPKITLKRTPLGGLALANKPLAESFASYAFSIGSNRLNSPTHPITWYNVKTKQPAVTVDMLSDTGADYSTLDAKFAPQLGIDITKGTPATVQGTGGTVASTFYIHTIPFRLGNLRPYNGLVAMGVGAGTNVFGRTGGLNWFDVAYTPKSVRYSELNTAMSAFAQTKKWGR